MKISSSFTHLHVFPNLLDFLSSVEHKSRYFEECWESSNLGSIDFYSMKYSGSQWEPGMFVCQHSLYHAFCNRKKCLQVCNDMNVNKLTNFIFRRTKKMVYPKIKVLSFTRIHVVPNL